MTRAISFRCCSCINLSFAINIVNNQDFHALLTLSTHRLIQLQQEVLGLWRYFLQEHQWLCA